jgi:AraC-like DNA-binding protein
MKRSCDLPLTIRPVVAIEDVYPAGFIDPYHTHHRSQLSYATSGVMAVMTEQTSFVLPPHRAVWLPAGTMHQVTCSGPVNINTLYIDPDLPDQPQVCRVFEVSGLVRALIHEILTFDHAYDVDGREGRIVRMLLDEIKRMPTIPLQAPMPQDRRLRRVCDMLMADPADQRSLDAWTRVAGMGRRTFTRAFKAETGMSLATWRQQVRLMAALSLLSSGRPITTVAYDVGYDSPSSFTAMFHRALGVPPSLYARGSLSA